ncbi:MAG TPA: hypothetical protein VLM85_32830 [Polyangiaceae bacterium]|nr:hypothetical protein [Polyangiaceae bacterium]
MRKSSIVLVVGLVAATGFALAYGSRDVGAPSASTPPPPAAENDMQGVQSDFGGGGPGPVDSTQPLPPNHPAINGAAGMGQAPQDNVHGGMGAGMGAAAAEEGEPPALAWKAPADWSPAPNPNAMRLATYKLPHGTADKDETELVVARAGGDVATNIARWAGQFDGSPTPKETHKTIHDLKVTMVQIEGTYQGGMGPSTGAHPGWAMLGAIVETKGESYFFKVIGPGATVHAAQKPFEAMIDGVTPN